jgi:hypothetical protein
MLTVVNFSILQSKLGILLSHVSFLSMLFLWHIKLITNSPSVSWHHRINCLL